MLLMLLCLLAALPAAAAADAGGTQAPAARPPARREGLAGQAQDHPRALTCSACASRASAACPAAHCSGNPHQVSTHGTLLLKGIGLKPGMVVAFPKSPGARISSVSPNSQPVAHLRWAIPSSPAPACW